jgi:hypothetical protein
VKTTIQGLPLPLGGIKPFAEMDRRSVIEVALVTVWGIVILVAVWLSQLKPRLSSAKPAALATYYWHLETGASNQVAIRAGLGAFLKWFCFPAASRTLNLWLLLRLGSWMAQAMGIVLLIQYCTEFNGEMMANVAPYYEVYDDPYSDANFVLAKKVSGRRCVRRLIRKTLKGGLWCQ